MNTKEMIAVMQAFVDGKDVQCKLKSDEVWEGGEWFSWDWRAYVYRVKPEPNVVYVNEYTNNISVYRCKENAENMATSSVIRKAVKYIEVID